MGVNLDAGVIFNGKNQYITSWDSETKMVYVELDGKPFNYNDTKAETMSEVKPAAIRMMQAADKWME